MSPTVDITYMTNDDFYKKYIEIQNITEKSFNFKISKVVSVCMQAMKEKHEIDQIESDCYSKTKSKGDPKQVFYSFFENV